MWPFIYNSGQAFPTIDSINPDIALNAGGVALTIHGANMSGASSITIDGVALTGLSVTPDGKTATGTLGTCPTGDGFAGGAVVTVGANMGVGGQFLWLPAGLVGYWDANVGVTLVSGAVSNWADQSGNGHDFSQSSAPARPAVTAGFTPNGLPAISGTSSQMATGNITMGSNVETTVWVGNIIINSSTLDFFPFFEFTTNAQAGTGGWYWGYEGSGGLNRNTNPLTFSPLISVGPPQIGGNNYGVAETPFPPTFVEIGVQISTMDHSVGYGTPAYREWFNGLEYTYLPTQFGAQSGANWPVSSYNIFGRNGSTGPSTLTLNIAIHFLFNVLLSATAITNMTNGLRARYEV
jgi:IPT/TIG domain-containing protein